MENNKLPNNLVELLQELKKSNIPKELYKVEIDKYLGFKARGYRIPIDGQFELTPLCNLDCKMCYIHLNKNQLNGAKLLSVNQWKDIMLQAKEAGMLYANLTGGECLTYPGFKELFIYLQSIGVEVSINTNGVLMDNDIIEFFKLHPPKKIQISLYGSNPKSYEQVTGKRCFSILIKNIKSAIEANLPIYFSMTPSKYMNDGEEIIKLANELNVNLNINSFLVEERENVSRKTCEADCSLNDYINLYKIKFGLDNSSNLIHTDLPAPGGNSTEIIYGYQCAAGRSRFHIDWRGIMHPCVNVQEISANPFESGFLKAWNNIVDASDKYVNPIECIECKYSKLCSICPAARKSAKTGHANPEQCKRAMAIVRAGLAELD